MAIADVVLATFHFGDGHHLRGARKGVPVITLPAQFFRGRFTLGRYRQMAMHECVADYVGAYVALVNRLVHDRDYRQHVVAKLNSSSDALFHDVAAVRELEHFFERALDAAPGRLVDDHARQWSPSQ